MKTARRDPTRYLTLERQMCAVCWSEGKRVMVHSLATDNRNARGFALRRRNAILRHLKAEHPKQYAEVMG